ncbi:NAD-P-binding protein [Trametes polyzona]|nr:NAD-P-binding protein [Trametes polyzona]
MSSATSPTTWLVTGASRGIGFETVRQLLESPNNLVIAACRTPEKASALHALKDSAKGTLYLVPLDVSDWDSIRAVPKAIEPILGDRGLDYLINNAGIGSMDTAFKFDPEEMLRVLRTNTVGPALVSQTLLPFVEKSKTKKIVNISSTVGSIASADQFGDLCVSYSMSKSALNMLTYKQKAERSDITAIAICPGWVKTDMGTQAAQLEPKDSVAGILKVITSAKPEDSGKYIRWNGEHIPW